MSIGKTFLDSKPSSHSHTHIILDLKKNKTRFSLTEENELDFRVIDQKGVIY